MRDRETDGWTDGRIGDRSIDGWMDGQVDGWTDGQIDKAVMHSGPHL